ncbi:MAG TPA: AI-2E family transporter [Microlunatus sp.]|nr:AI-2E family transporter [Microlunatus sp.]
MTIGPHTGPALSGRQGFSPASRVLLTLAAATVAIAGLHMARGVIAPLAIAALVVMVAHSARRPLDRRGVPSAVATAAVIVVAYLILLVMGVLLLIAVSQFVQLLPQYADQLAATEDQLVKQVSQLGLDTSSAKSLVSSINPAKLLGLAGAVSSAVLGAGTAFFFVLAYIVFMAADAGGFGGLVQRFADSKAGVIESLTRFSKAVRKYLMVNTVFGAIVAVLDGIVLIVLGVPGTLLWVILAFVTNYIPNIGFVIALIPPALLALLTGGWADALAVIIAYCLINVTMQTFIQPKFVSDAVNLSLTLTFFSVIFWAVVLGPIGAVLAIPATLLVRAMLLELDPEAVWARWVTGDQVEPSGSAPPPEPPTDPPPAMAREDAPVDESATTA